MVEKQRKTPYPSPPRFLPFKDMCMRFGGGFHVGFAVLFVSLLCLTWASCIKASESCVLNGGYMLFVGS